MRISPVYSGSSEFLAVYREIYDDAVTLYKQDQSRLYNLRCSQLPYCPRSVLLDHLTYGRHRPMPMSMAYYTKVGTTVHEVMQSYLAMSGRFLADYHCKVCGKKYPFSHKHECCGTPTTYYEVTIDVGTKKGVLGIQGHIDGIFKDSKGNYWIVDFKTTSIAGVKGKLRNPGDGYIRQIRAYAVLLRKQYKVKVKGVMLVFIPRDNPAKPAVWEATLSERDYEVAMEELKADKRLHKKTMFATSVEDIIELAKTNCGGAFCTSCKKSKPDFMSLIKKAMKTNKAKLPIMSQKIVEKGVS